MIWINMCLWPVHVSRIASVIYTPCWAIQSLIDTSCIRACRMWVDLDYLLYLSLLFFFFFTRITCIYVFIPYTPPRSALKKKKNSFLLIINQSSCLHNAARAVYLFFLSFYCNTHAHDYFSYTARSIATCARSLPPIIFIVYLNL